MDKILKFLIGFMIGYVGMSLLINYASAKELAPKPFQNSDIKRTLEDGTVQKFDGNEYMIVKRGNKKPKVVVSVKPEPHCVVPVEALNAAGRLVEQILKNQEALNRKNRISLLAGFSPENNLDLDLSSGVATISLDYKTTFGVQYQRKLNKRWNAGALLFSNESGFLSLGIDF